MQGCAMLFSTYSFIAFRIFDICFIIINIYFRSFGHHQAKEFKVNSGWQHLKGDDLELAKRGFCLTRKSVTMVTKFYILCRHVQGIYLGLVEVALTFKFGEKLAAKCF